MTDAIGIELHPQVEDPSATMLQQECEDEQMQYDIHERTQVQSLGPGQRVRGEMPRPLDGGGPEGEAQEAQTVSPFMGDQQGC